jgi:hypothetical protein
MGRKRLKKSQCAGLPLNESIIPEALSRGVFSAMGATPRVSLFPWIASELPNSAFAFAFSEPENQITNYETKTDRYDHGAVFMRSDDELR